MTEEKIINKLYSRLVLDKCEEGEIEKVVYEFTREYTKTVFKSSRFKEQVTKEWDEIVDETSDYPFKNSYDMIGLKKKLKTINISESYECFDSIVKDCVCAVNEKVAQMETKEEYSVEGIAPLDNLENTEAAIVENEYGYELNNIQNKFTRNGYKKATLLILNSLPEETSETLRAITINDSYDTIKELIDEDEREKYGNNLVEVNGKVIETNIVDEEVTENPQLQNEYKMLKYKFNEDGSVKSFDELAKARIKDVEAIANDKRFTNEDKRAKKITETNRIYFELQKQSLERDNSDETMKDCIQRLGYNNFINEIDNLIKYDIPSKTAEEEYYDENRYAITQKLSDENLNKLDYIKNDEVNENKKELDTELINKIDERIKVYLEQYKENPPEQYTEEEEKEADRKREEERKKYKDKLKANRKERKQKSQKEIQETEPYYFDTKVYSGVEEIEKEEKNKKKEKQVDKPTDENERNVSEEDEKDVGTSENTDSKKKRKENKEKDKEDQKVVKEKSKTEDEPEKDDKKEIELETDKLNDKIDDLTKKIDDLKNKSQEDMEKEIDKIRVMLNEQAEKDNSDEMKKYIKSLEDKIDNLVNEINGEEKGTRVESQKEVIEDNNQEVEIQEEINPVEKVVENNIQEIIEQSNKQINEYLEKRVEDIEIPKKENYDELDFEDAEVQQNLDERAKEYIKAYHEKELEANEELDLDEEFADEEKRREIHAKAAAIIAEYKSRKIKEINESDLTPEEKVRKIKELDKNYDNKLEKIDIADLDKSNLVENSKVKVELENEYSHKKEVLEDLEKSDNSLEAVEQEMSERRNNIGEQ